MEKEIFEEMEYEGEEDWLPFFDPHSFEGLNSDPKI